MCVCPGPETISVPYRFWDAVESRALSLRAVAETPTGWLPSCSPPFPRERCTVRQPSVSFDTNAELCVFPAASRLVCVHTQPAESLALLVSFLKSGLTERQVVKYLSVFSCIGPVGESSRQSAFNSTPRFGFGSLVLGGVRGCSVGSAQISHGFVRRSHA